MADCVQFNLISTFNFLLAVFSGAKIIYLDCVFVAKTLLYSPLSFGLYDVDGLNVLLDSVLLTAL